MIRLLDKEDLKTVKEDWKRHYGEAYTASHFEKCLKEGDIYVLEEDGVLKASMAAFCFPIVFHGKLLRTSFLLPALSDEEEAGRKLEEALIDMKSHTELLILSSERLPGFSLLTERYLSSFQKAGAVLEGYEVCEDISEEEMTGCYGEYMSHFDLYCYYSPSDMRSKKEEEEKEGYQLLAVRKGREVKAYCFYKEEEDRVSIRECTYTDSRSLYSLMGTLSKKNKEIEADTAKVEVWKFLGEHERKEGRKIYGFVSRFDLFNKLYQCNMHNHLEAFSISGKPFNFTEVIGR